MTPSRRTFLNRCALLGAPLPFPAILHAESPAHAARASVELAHTELWRRFVDPQDVLLDFTNLDGSVSLPAPEECRAGKPNALGWWAPNENGAMFNGLYLDGAVNRALATGAEPDRAKARRLVEGLLRLAACSEVKGFIGRGYATDGRTTWPMGSNDQTGPWFYGLWRYLASGLADAGLRQRIVAKVTEVAGVLVQTGWRMPADPPFHFRGSFNGFAWSAAPRLLLVCKVMHQLTQDAAWEDRYRAALRETPKGGGMSRLEICEHGMVFEAKGGTKPVRSIWTGSCAAVALRALWEMETDEAVRAAFARGLSATAEVAAEGMGLRLRFDPEASLTFEGDWRKLNALWKPQETEDEAHALANVQLQEINRLSPARRAELQLGREAIFGAWVVTLCPEREVVQRYEPEILATLARFRADRMHYVSFFPLECAWWRLQAT